ncbi:hypothetical protein JCM16138_12850 [Thermococcus atlanticus]
MPRVKRGGLCFMLLAILLLTPTAMAAPYWAKPGVYIKYAAMRYDPYIKYMIEKGNPPRAINTAELMYLYRGILFRIYAKNDTNVTFRFLGEEKGYMTVALEIAMSNVTIMTIVRKDTKIPRFWDEKQVIWEKIEKSHDVGFLDCIWPQVKLKTLEIRKLYRIRLSDGTVFDMNGTAYGHTILWVNTTNPPAPGSIFGKWRESVITVYNTSTPRKSVMTYYRKFGPPVMVMLFSVPDMNLSQRVDSQRNYTFFSMTVFGPSGSAIYDPSSGMVIAPVAYALGVIPDLRAAGIVFATFTDEHSAYLALAKHDFSWASGLVLYRTNAWLGGVERLPFPKPRTQSEYVFYASLLILAVSVVKKARR